MTDLIIRTRQLLTQAIIAKFAVLVGKDNAMTAVLLANAIALLIGNRGASAAGIDAMASTMTAGDAAGVGAGGRRPLDAGLALLAGLFGSKVELMARALAAASGSTISAATRALALSTMLVASAAAALLASEGRPATRAQLAALLAANQPAALAAMPAALQTAIASLPGLAGLYGVPGAGSRRNLAGLLLAGLVATIVLFAVLLNHAF